MSWSRTVLAALALAAAGASHAQAPRPPAAAPAIEQYRWARVNGTAVDLSVGADGTVFAIDQGDGVWMRRPGDSQADWIRPFGDGKFRRIDAAAQDMALAIDLKGGVHVFDGTVLRPAGLKAKDVGVSQTAGQAASNGPLRTVDKQNHVFAIRENGDLHRYDPRRGFEKFSGAPENLGRVAVDDRGQPWVITENGAVHRFDGKRWLPLPGMPMADLSARGGMVYGVAFDGQVHRWRDQGARWVPVAAIASSVAVAPDGRPWIATRDGGIFAVEPDTAKSASRVARMQTFTQIMSWTPVYGQATELAISGNGTILALSPKGELYQRKGKGDWSTVVGRFERIAVAPDGTPWAIEPQQHRILEYTGVQWKQSLPGTALDLAIGPRNEFWIVRLDGVPARWDTKTRNWQALEGLKAGRIAVDQFGQPWVIAAGGKVSRHDGKAWSGVDGVEARSIAIGPEGTVFAVGTDGRAWRYDRLGKRWDALNADDVAAIAVGPRGKPWVAKANHAILASSFFEDERIDTLERLTVARRATTQQGSLSSAAPPPAGSAAKATTAQALQIADFRQITGFAARDIAIGNDGSVFVVADGGALFRWNNAQGRFLSFPGSFARIAVAPDGKPWAVTGGGAVARYDGSQWRPIPNITAKDIAVSLNGTVMVTTDGEILYRYVPALDRFERVFAEREGEPAPAGTRIALDPRGRPWTVTSDNVLWRCDRGPCERLTQPARDVAIGPEGSVFVVGTDYVLRRFNARAEEWDRVNIAADQVAVGPGGWPWIVNAKSEVWRTQLFPRDESQDTGVAASSSSGSATVLFTSATGVPLFNYSLNMAFDLVPWPAGFTLCDPGSGCPPGPVAPNDWIPMAVTSAGKLVVIDAGPTFAFWNYDDLLKRLVKDTTVPSPASVLGTFPLQDKVRNLAIGKDGTYWITNDAGINPPGIWRRQGSQWVAVGGLDDCAATPGCGLPSSYSVTVGADGTVFASSAGNNIYRYDSTQLKFVKHTAVPRPPNGGVLNIGIDPSSGRLWAGTPGSAPPNAALYEFVAGTWVNRTDATIGPPGTCLFNTAPCMSASNNGNIYGFGALGKLVHWNATLSKWETLPNSPTWSGVVEASYIAAPDGRPWFMNGTNLYRGR